ncbi:hypothetical protein [Leptothermofonsia sp. ETS-13]|uniref:hypothetical protein n=1 Tax=Leptothermofonsia sp. ETS-13 TaxID=3035696 RepID=UPI003BA3B156
MVRIAPLDNQQRREELAQLAGGESIQEAIAFAESLLIQAANLRQNHSTNAANLLNPPTEPPPSSTPRSNSVKTKISKKVLMPA